MIKLHSEGKNFFCPATMLSYANVLFLTHVQKSFQKWTLKQSSAEYQCIFPYFQQAWLYFSKSAPNILCNELGPIGIMLKETLMSFYLLYLYIKFWATPLSVSPTCVSLWSLPVRWFSEVRWNPQACRLNIRTRVAEKRETEKVVCLRDLSGMLW